MYFLWSKITVQT